MKILALSKMMFDEYLKKKNVTPDNVETFDKVLFISINNEDDDKLRSEFAPYFPQDKKNVKVMTFADVEKDIKITKLDGTGTFMVHAMTKDQARELYTFIKDNIKDKETVLVHCTAGISRSGAIVSFIHDFVGGNWEEFKIDNKNILPNSHVYRLLYDEWYKDLEFPKGWTKEKEKEFQLELMNPKSPEMQIALQNDREGDNSQSAIHYLTRNEILERWGNRIKKNDLEKLKK